MSVLSPKGKAHFEKLRKNNISHLKNEHGVGSAIEYLKFSNGIETASEPAKVLNYLEENDISLDTFFHPSPLLDQDIMYVSLNPALKNVSCSKFESGSWFNRNNSNGDVEKITWTTTVALGNHLYDNYASEEMIKILKEKIDSLPGERQKSYKEYVAIESQNELSSSYYSDVFHTRFCKLASVDGGFINLFGKEHLRSEFAKEIELVEPKLLITGCRDAWRSIQDYFVDDPESDIHSHRSSTVAKKYSKRANKTALPGVFEIPTKDLWVVTLSQESRPFQDFDEFKNNIEYVNERVEL